MRCYDAGRRYYSRNFVLFFLPRSESPLEWRLGLAVTRKTGTAVVRNRVKRMLRDFFRLHQDLLPPTADLVVVPKRHMDPDRLTQSVLETEFVPLLAALAAPRAALDKGCAT